MAGSIIQRGKNTWLVRLFVKRDETGKRRYENRTVHGNKSDAQDALDDLRKDKKNGALSGTALLVGDLLDGVIRDYRINGKDAKWAEGVVKRLREAFSKMRVSKLKPEHVEAYTDRRIAAKAKNQTINHELSMLRRGFNLAVKKRRLSAVPFRIERLKVNNTRKGFFEHAEYTSLRACLPDELKPVLTMAYYTGCRKAEILGLRWSQVDLVHRMIRLEAGETKNDEPRIIPLRVEELYQSISMQRSIHDERFPESPWVFSRQGERIVNFYKAWENACKAAGLVDGDGEPNKLFHDLRRTGVRNLIRADVPEKVAMLISGHKTRSVFERYNIVNERDVIDAMRRLDTYTRDRVSAEEAQAAEKKAHKAAHKPIPPS
jgi:integrase